MDKLLSGRYILTLGATFILIWGTVTKALPSEAIVAIVMYVVQAYFNKVESQPKETK